MRINIAEDFSPVPSGRFLTDGPDSGQRFREEFLVPAIRRGVEEIVIDIDGTAGYGSSFLEEAFGGLIRNKIIDAARVNRLIRIRSEDPDYAMYKDLIYAFLNDAANR